MIAPLLITLGEPAGIGPDIVLQAAQQTLPGPNVVLGDIDVLKQRAEQLSLPVQIHTVTASLTAVPTHTQGHLWVWPHPMQPVVPGRLDPANAQAVVDSLSHATQACLDGTGSAMVTAPIQKSVINDAGIMFSGHTEWLAALTQARPVMLLATAQTHRSARPLRVALATTHLPLSQVSQTLTTNSLLETLTIIDHDLRRHFHLSRPQILVCGLNPHAGEGGHLGHEEQTIIEPALAAARQAGIDVIGPLPADTLFQAKYLDQADVVLAMYHDQGLPVLKYAGFGQAVNVTLGLPIIRTSVDHGTALDLAGTGEANADSFLQAYQLAYELACLNESA